jgi:hypothetical protein
VQRAVIRFRIVIAVLACALGATPAAAATIRETLDQFGFFGRWAVDCDQAASLDNNVRSAYVAATGDAIFTERLSPNSEPNVYVILSARRVGDDTIVLRIKLNGMSDQDLTMRKSGGRIRTFTNRDPHSGTLLVKNGIVGSIGRETPWLTRCAAPADERQQPQ